MKFNPPIDLPVKSMTAKISVGAQARLKNLAGTHNARISDVLSACILHMPEATLVKVLDKQREALETLPNSVKRLLRNLDKLTDADREMLKDIL